MKKILASAAALGVLAAAAPAFAQSGASVPATANASATIIDPITIEKNKDMAFGTIISGPGTVSTATGATNTAQVVSGNTTSPAAFDVNGNADRAYTVTLASSSINLTSGNNTMPVALSVLDGVNKAVVNGDADDVVVNGVLTVASAQAAGVYTGEVGVSVQYD